MHGRFVLNVIKIIMYFVNIIDCYNHFFFSETKSRTKIFYSAYFLIYFSIITIFLIVYLLKIQELHLKEFHIFYKFVVVNILIRFDYLYNFGSI